VSLSTGDVAPDFSLPGTGGQTYSLSNYRGKSVVLAFYPGDNTPVCTRQLNEYNNELDRFVNLDAQVLAISPQDVSSHEAFSDKHEFKFPLLADTDKKVFQLYGALGPLGFARRSVFVVDAEGTIRYAHRAIAGLTYRHVDELVAVLEGLGTKH